MRPLAFQSVLILQDLLIRSEMKTMIRARVLVANSVFLDLVLESPKTNAQQPCGIFSMVGDFLQSPFNDLSFNLLQDVPNVISIVRASSLLTWISSGRCAG